MTNQTQIILENLNTRFEKKKADEILYESINNFFLKKIVYVCSFGAESAVILHLISNISKDFPVIFLNTEKLFIETLSYRDDLVKLFNLTNIIEVFPKKFDLKKYDAKDILWKDDQNKCCEIRKVNPLKEALQPYNTWISGRKGYHSNERKEKKVLEVENNKFVLSPLINWSQNNIIKYFERFNIPKHPLFKKGYLSIGCENCTVVSSKYNNIRSGRWINTTKTECGIHKN